MKLAWYVTDFESECIFPSSVNFAMGTYGHFEVQKLFVVVEQEMYAKLNEVLGNGVLGPYAVEIPISIGGACIGEMPGALSPKAVRIGLKCCQQKRGFTAKLQCNEMKSGCDLILLVSMKCII